MKKIIIIFLLLFSNLFSKTIITVAYPFQEYFIKKISYENIYIKTVFTYKKEFDLKDERLLENLATSNYYFSMNLPEERKIIKLLKEKNSDLKVIDISKNLRNLKLDNGEENPYIWLDPILVRELTTNIYNELLEIMSYNEYLFTDNYKIFMIELDDLYLRLKERITGSDLYGFFTFNNKFDYFAKRFRVEVYHREYRAIRIDEISDLIEFSQKEHINHLLIENGSDYTIAQSLGGNIKSKIIELDIYEKNWKVMMFKLIRGLTNF